MNAGIKIIGMSDEDTCGCCGKTNLKRTVRVEVNGEEQHWGVICASKARGERGTAADTKYLAKFATFAEQAKKILAAGGTLDAVQKLPVGFPCWIKNGKFQAFNGVNQVVVEFAV
jgi:hypothetical protein